MTGHTRPATAAGTKTTRRRLFAAAMIAALVMSSCGDDAGSEANADAQGSVAEGTFPVTIDGDLGSTTLERAPERILSVGQYRDTDAALALGVVPLATPDLSGFIDGGISPWAARKLGAKKLELFDSDELPYERIAELKPDLILGTDRSALDEEYDTLHAIAPTLSYANGYNKDEWQLTTTRVATALGRADQADALIQEVEKAVLDARAAHPEFAGKTFTFGPVSVDGTVNTINSTTDASVLFLQALGLELSPDVLDLPQANFPGRATISPERLDLLDADVILLTFNSRRPERRSKRTRCSRTSTP